MQLPTAVRTPRTELWRQTTKNLNEGFADEYVANSGLIDLCALSLYTHDSTHMQEECTYR